MIDLDVLQEACNYFYDKYGASDEVINFQVLINLERAERNESDKCEAIYGKFVQ